ncbi:MAG: hypothetical protein H7248_05405 [Microbacteriaceae bacterium]|nr:hypothetical protein [Microbacteriaceae bacterium]
MDHVNASLAVGLALVIFIATVLVLRRTPVLAFALWVATLSFVPYWLGVTVSVYFPPTTAVGIVVVAALFTQRRYPQQQYPQQRPRLGLVDLIVVAVIVVQLVALALKLGTLTSSFVLIAHWGLGYLLGRVVATQIPLEQVYRIVAVVLSVVAVLALLEFATRNNIFVPVRANNALYATWSPLLERGGLLRVEGAFGHPIALGASLALAIPLTLASSFRLWLRGCMVFVLVGATVVTFSRTGMLCAIIALVLSVVSLRNSISARARTVFVGGTIGIGVLATPLVLGTFSEAGTEATASASYRGDLLSLIPSMASIGLAANSHRNASGETFFGSFHSIDSALIYFGLTNGLIPLILVMAILLAALVLVMRARATPATLAIVAQLPAVATVALITQFAMFFWVVCGIAVSTQLTQSWKGAAPLIGTGAIRETHNDFTTSPYVK